MVAHRRLAPDPVRNFSPIDEPPRLDQMNA